MIRQGLALLPRDGLFLKDGRGWYTSDVGRSHAHPWPLPPTIRGALRAAAGRAFMQRSGRTLAREDWAKATEGVLLQRMVTLRRPLDASFAPEHRMWPVPADALHVRGQVDVVRLDPEPPRLPTLGPADAPGVEALWRPYPRAAGKPLPAPAFWPEANLLRWLRGEPVKGDARGDLALAPAQRAEVHVTLDPETQGASAGLLFSSTIVEGLAPGGQEWAIGVDCALPEDIGKLPSGPLLLGGRRRIVHAEPMAEAVFAPPRALFGDTAGLRLILVTPAEFAQGWLPDGFQPTEEPAQGPFRGRLPGIDGEVLLRAAYVPRALHLSTWDMARPGAPTGGPRPTRRLVPAGAVYFFERAGGGTFSARDVAELWLCAWGSGQGDGLGLVVPGRWDPSAKERA